MSDATVGIIMGSKSDWETMRHAAETLDALGVTYEVKVVRRPPHPASACTIMPESATDRGLKLIIAGAGGAAHLPGMAASMTTLPVLGVPVESKALKGMDSLLSIVQMPAGVPVGTLAIGQAGGGQCRAAGGGDAGDDRRGAGRTARGVARGTDRRGAPRRLNEACVASLAPGSTIGIIGGGQLGRMMAMAAARLGYRCHIFDPH